jgi:nitroreductase
MAKKAPILQRILFLIFFLFLVVSPIFSFRCLSSESHEQFKTGQNHPGLDLKETFEVYVKSIQNSNLESLFTTVTNSDEFFFLTASGTLIDSREGYYKFHEDWFREKDWEMPVDLLTIHEGKEYGYTTAIFNYREKISQGGMHIINSYFTLIFHKEDNMWKVVADVCTPISRYRTELNPEIKYSFEQTYFFEILKTRRTVRKFKPTSVPREHILKILDAARYAPTAGNQQPWKFLVIQDKEKLDKLKGAAFVWTLDRYKHRTKPTSEELSKAEENLQRMLEEVLSAPVYVIVLVDSNTEHSDYVLYDGTLAVGNLMVAARALGYGTGFFTTFFPAAKIKEFFKIPERYKVICITPIGVPEEWPEAPKKKALEDFIVFQEISLLE